jgi:late competence protein required for DNA uptake (superfamily II DNA/RNA helicase)
MLQRENDMLQLRDWQAELFQSVEWGSRLNVIVTMPTASGKSILIDMALHTMNEGRADFVIVGQPFIALCLETVRYLKKFYPSRQIVSMYSNTHGYPTINSAVVATYENMCRAIENCRAIRADARIVMLIDEIHNIYDKSRGHNITEGIIKALCRRDTKIVMMTATLESDARDFLQEWTNAYHYTRAMSVTHATIWLVCRKMHCSTLQDGQFIRTDTPREIVSGDAAKNAIHLLKTTGDAQIVIFANTRDKTRRIAEEICTELRDETVAASHNALMEHEEKKIVVRMFNDHTVRCIVCTSTLSTGVNLRDVTHVFVLGPKKWNGSTFVPYQRAELYQMCGRVARCEGDKGAAYLLEEGDTCECRQFMDIVATPSTEGIPQHITNGFALKMYVKNYPYETVGNPLTYTEDIFDALPPALQEIDFTELFRMGEFNCELVPSTRIAAVARSGLPLVEGLQLAETLIRQSGDFHITDEFHLLLLCMTDSATDITKLCALGTTQWTVFVEYMKNATNPHLVEDKGIIMRSANYEQVLMRPDTRLILSVKTLFAAFLVMRWIPGIWRAETMYLADVLDAMMIKAEHALRLCTEMHLSLMATLMEHVAVRLRNGTSGDKNSLGCLPSCSRTLARSLKTMGLVYIEQIVGMQTAELAMMIGTDARRKNHLYNTAVAAKMIKEARKLSFAGSAIVPLTK